jgi:hypothetical protein
MPGLASNCDPPIVAFYVAGMTGISQFDICKGDTLLLEPHLQSKWGGPLKFMPVVVLNHYLLSISPKARIIDMNHHAWL